MNYKKILLLCVLTVGLSACSTKVDMTADTQTQTDTIETSPDSTTEQEPDPVVEGAKPMETEDDLDSLSADLEGTVIVEESFN